jgi:hypothetical protein
MFLDAIVVYPALQLESVYRGLDGPGYARLGQWDDQTRTRAKLQRPYVALRWVLNPALGIPLAPFTVWRRPVEQREPAEPVTDWKQTGFFSFGWDGMTEMLRIEINLVAAATVTGGHQADADPVQSVSGAAGQTVVLDAGPMLGLRVDKPAAMAAGRGQSLVQMANGNGWQPVEIVGPPLRSGAGGDDYANDDQGPVGALSDPVSAAISRLDR